jgi:hypothetical protein
MGASSPELKLSGRLAATWKLYTHIFHGGYITISYDLDFWSLAGSVLAEKKIGCRPWLRFSHWPVDRQWMESPFYPQKKEWRVRSSMSWVGAFLSVCLQISDSIDSICDPSQLVDSYLMLVIYSTSVMILHDCTPSFPKDACLFQLIKLSFINFNEMYIK